jgi:Tol biopolymer transport system component
MPRKSTRKFLPRIFANKRGLICLLILATGCRNVIDRQQNVTPRVLRDVPARNLAYRLSPDVSPPSAEIEDLDKFAAVANDFSTKRKDEALLRTVVSPDGRRVLALYGGADDSSSTFRIDLYNSDGQFIRNLIPPELACVFPETVTWSPDGNFMTFIAHRRAAPNPTPTPLEVPEAPTPKPGASPLPSPSPSVAPLFPSVATFSTEQIYICNRDGYDLKPFTAREGLIYFYFVWAPDGHAMAALACKEDEWNARERQFKMPAGRPRVIAPDGSERLLDDALTDALPVWSPDASKIATAFETDVAIYDAGGKSPTQARVPLSDQLLAASVAYDEKTTVKKANSNANTTQTASSNPSVPASFNPIVRLDWRRPETLYFQTAYVRLMPNETINTFQRWHALSISAQAAVLK